MKLDKNLVKGRMKVFLSVKFFICIKYSLVSQDTRIRLKYLKESLMLY